MAKKKQPREWVWLKCESCGSRNYRVQRKMGQIQPKKGGRLANMDQNQRLVMNKYCPKERKHTLHKEDRKK